MLFFLVFILRLLYNSNVCLLYIFIWFYCIFLSFIITLTAEWRAHQNNMCKISYFLFHPISFFISFCTKLFHPKSIRKLFICIFTGLILLFILIFLITSLNYSVIMRNRVYDSIKDTLSVQNNNISQNFQTAMGYLSENCLNNSDISYLNTTTNIDEVYVNALRIKKALSIGNQALSSVGGLFIYSEIKDIFIPQTNESWDNTLNIKEINRKCSYMIRDLLREKRASGTLSTLNTSSWFLLGNGSDQFLIRILKSRNTYAGAWTSIDYLSSTFKSFAKMNAVVLYVDQDGTCIGNSAFSGIKLDPQESLESPSYYRPKSSGRYLVVSTALDYCDDYITVLIPDSYIFQELSCLHKLMFLLFIWLFLLCIALVGIMTRFFNEPSRILSPVIDSLHRGEFDTKIETTQNFQEIQNIVDTFNNMIEEIQSLRIHIYEEELTNKDLELQYLKTQIAPHFLINCLNTIFVLSQEPANTTVTHALVLTLSEHLRYTLASRTEVSMEEEISHVKNYLYLTQLRFPDTLKYEIDLEDGMEQAQVFPLLLLMLTENSIKINVVMGEAFLVRIHGSIHVQNGQKRIHLVHIDSGKGFNKDYLPIYNHITEHPEITEKGKSIGLYNTAMRLKLIFGGSASIRFSNEPDMGARVDMDIPYIPYHQEEI